MKVVVYSHEADTRARIRLAIGRRPAPDVPEADIIEVATAPALFRLLDIQATLKSSGKIVVTPGKGIELLLSSPA